MTDGLTRYQLSVPDGWKRVENQCYPEKGSKAYKSTATAANVHVVNLYDSGRYVVTCEDPEGDFSEERYSDYFDALAHARGFMLRNQ